MASVPTYAHYHDLGGTHDEASFNASLRAAEAAVRAIVGFNEPQNKMQQEAYIRAVCAAVEVDQAYGASGGIGEGLASISVGSFSASSNGTVGNSYDADMRRAIRHELVGSCLLYQGIS